MEKEEIVADFLNAAFKKIRPFQGRLDSLMEELSNALHRGTGTAVNADWCGEIVRAALGISMDIAQANGAAQVWPPKNLHDTLHKLAQLEWTNLTREMRTNLLDRINGTKMSNAHSHAFCEDMAKTDKVSDLPGDLRRILEASIAEDGSGFDIKKVA